MLFYLLFLDPYDELANGKGVVFICSPNAGELDAFEKKTIVVTALSDMWGDYKDFIVLNVSNLLNSLQNYTYGVHV